MDEGWGIELWDRFREVCDVVNDDTDNLDKVFKAYMKERSKIETEYARGLKGLCKKYNTKHGKKQTNDEEYTKVSAFREILKQLEFQANQHEILAETLGFEQSKLVDQKVKESRNQLKNYRKEQKDAEINLQKSYKSLDASKLKYQKSYSDRELAKSNYEKAEVDGTYSRNDVAKLKNLFLQKDRNNEESKAQYANQMGKTNKDQQEYFDNQMTTVLQNLEKLHKDNISFWIQTVNNCVNIEVSVKGIIAKCHESMLAEVCKVNADTDAELVITNLKTGNIPPEDFQFEELGPDSNLKSFGTGTLSRSQTNLSVDSPNLYQKKRELEKLVEEKKKEEASAQKEMKALQMMVETYKNNPKFGDARKFQSELDSANAKTQKIGSEIQELQSNLSSILSKLDRRKDSRSPMRSRSNTSFSSNSSTPTNLLNSVADTDFDDDEFDNESVLSIPVPPPVIQNSSAPPPPPPPPFPQPAQEKEIFATALYAYETETEDTLNIAEGDKFLVLEMDFDGEGWTNVRRVSDGMEGFVPTSYIEITN